MIDIDNFTASPNTVETGKDNEITFSWDASINRDSDNPVEIDLKIENDNPVFFLDVNDKKVKEVAWSTSQTQQDPQSFSETLFLVVSPKPLDGGITKVLMTATDNNGVSSSNECFLNFQ